MDGNFVKPPRYSSVIGNYGEVLVRNWLLRSDFRVIPVDYIGIDLIAYNPSTGERMGISVKSRGRETAKKGAGQRPAFHRES